MLRSNQSERISPARKQVYNDWIDSDGMFNPWPNSNTSTLNYSVHRIQYLLHCRDHNFDWDWFCESDSDWF